MSQDVTEVGVIWRVMSSQAAKNVAYSRVSERGRAEIFAVDLQQLRILLAEDSNAPAIDAAGSQRIARIDHDRRLRLRLQVAGLAAARRSRHIDMVSIKVIPHGHNVDGTIGIRGCKRCDISTV
jgi:hypothetical protein